MNSVEKKLHVLNTLSSMGFDYHTDQIGFIYVDDDHWQVWCSEEDPTVVEVTFAQNVSAGYAGDVVNRLAWPLQVMAFKMVVQPGYFEPTHQV
jgi:hypothetical protein